jgi:arylsulfatase A-like enzyme
VRSTFPRPEELDKDFDAMPARFARSGYRTAVVGDFAADIFDRLPLGFQITKTPHTSFAELIRIRAISRATPLLPLIPTPIGRRLFPSVQDWNLVSDPRWVAEQARRTLHETDAQPFFLTVFFSTTHFPYAAPAPYCFRYADRSYRGRFKYQKDIGLSVDAALADADIRQTRALYDGSVAAIDAAAGELLDDLAERGLDKNTIVVVTSDHGETLFEHRRWQGHGDHLFGDEATHIPLSIFDPRMSRPRREPAVVQAIDLAPTLYELVGVAKPSDLDGQSLAPAVRGEPVESRFAYSETELWLGENPAVPRKLRLSAGGVMDLLELGPSSSIIVRKDVFPSTLTARHRMVRDQRYKLIYAPTPEGVKYFLYDTLTDPEELEDISEREPGQVERLKQELFGWMRRDPRAIERDGMFIYDH